jgi:membrane-bound serine protease (ClpP class)
MVHVFLFHPLGWLIGFVVLGGLATAVWYANRAWGAAGAWGVGLGGSALGIVLLNLAMNFIPRTRMGRGLVLQDDEEQPPASTQVARNAPEGATQEEQHRALVGRTGITTTRLRPSGTIEIDDRRIHVVADGVSIEAGEQVEVVSVAGNRVVVRRVET